MKRVEWLFTLMLTLVLEEQGRGGLEEGSLVMEGQAQCQSRAEAEGARSGAVGGSRKDQAWEMILPRSLSQTLGQTLF